MATLGVSLDGTVCGASIYSEQGALLGDGRAVFQYESTNGVTLARPADVLSAFVRAVSAAAAQVEGEQVAALAITGSGEGLVALGRDGTPIGPCVYRVPGALGCASSGLAPDVYFAMTGRFAHEPTGFDILHWYRHERQVFPGQVWRYVPVEAYLLGVLGGQVVIDPSMASRTFSLNIVSGDWERKLLEPCGIKESQLPPVMMPATRVGRLTPRLAADLGLEEGIQLVLGGWCGACEALGAGVLEPGRQALYSMKASFELQPSFSAISLTALLLQNAITMGPHVQPDTQLGMWRIRDGGAMLRWFRDHIAKNDAREARSRGYSVYDKLLAEMPAGPAPLLYWPSGAAGEASSLMGLEPEITRGELLLAILEGITEEMRDGLERFRRVGIPIESLRATGGGSLSDVLLQLTADILDCEVERIEQHGAERLGAAILAAIGTGLHDSLEQAADAAVHITSHFEPRMDVSNAYTARRETRKENRPRGVWL